MNWDFLADILKAMGHPVRLRIVAILSEGEENVGDLAGKIGASHSAISQQLSILRMRGLVFRRHYAGHAVYSLKEPRLRDLISCMRQYRTPVLTSVADNGAGEEDLREIASTEKGGGR